MVNASNESNSTADRLTTEPGFQWSYVQTAETIIATTGTISSLVVIVVMAARPSLRKQLTYQLTICLAVADCVSCVFLVPRTLRGSFAIPHGIAGEIYCRTIKATVLWNDLRHPIQDASCRIRDSPGLLSGRVAIKAKHKVVKMYLIVCLAFCVCWAPNQLLFLIANFGYRINYNGGLYNSTRVLAAVNSCLNPFIYAVWSRPFRQGVKAVFCRRRKTWNTDHSYVSNISSSVRSTIA
ncbi:galanin receptor 2b-like [Ptychodera flava]|uniref:galanin receptor 2b-like n=1 Tax=Ptychodera flava TaxID=63121 RepID=UPI003969FC13